MIDDVTTIKGIFDYFWTHALNSDQTHHLIKKYCDFTSENISAACINATISSILEKGSIDSSNIYAPLCYDSSLKNGSTGSVSIPLCILICIASFYVDSDTWL